MIIKLGRILIAQIR